MFQTRIAQTRRDLYKGGDAPTLLTLATLIGEMETAASSLNAEVVVDASTGKKVLKDAKVVAIIKKNLDNTTSNLAIYEANGSTKHADNTRAELKVFTMLYNQYNNELSSSRLNDDQILAVMQAYLAENEGVKMGALMSFMKINHADKYDAGSASRIAKTLV